MRWVTDRTGRFHKRPHYDPAELNFKCEKLISEFLMERHGSVRYPISTDDLTILLESLTRDLDLYADLSEDGEDVEGITDFFPGKRPRVRISNRLSSQARFENRLRTTLTHELGHVKFHAFMFDVERPQSLFASDQLEANKCKRDSILSTVLSDWMEWQAGFACGAFLIPSTALSEFTAIADIEATYSKMDTTSREGLQLISDVADYSSLPRGGPCAAAPAANPHGTHRGHQFILTSDDCVFLCPGDLLISRSAYMLIQLQQEQNKMPNQTDHPQTGPDVTITIDNKLFSVHRGNISISELKALGGVPAGYEFEEIVNRILKPLSDGAQLVLKGGEIFVSHPRAGASS